MSKTKIFLHLQHSKLNRSANISLSIALGKESELETMIVENLSTFQTKQRTI